MARPLTVVPAQPVAAVTNALIDALSGGTALCVLPATPEPSGRGWATALHLDQPAPDEVAALVATSGSTGRPHAVLLTAGALLASAHAALRRLDGPGAWLLALPPSSVGGLQVLIRSHMASLDPVCLDLIAGFHPDAFALAARELPGGPPHYTSLVPTQLRRLVDAGGAALEALAGFDAVLIGGAALDAALRTAAEAAGVRIVSTYGMTETSGGCVYDGVPLEGVHVRASPTGLRIGGEVVALGYHAEPEETRKSFVDDWFRTHDLGQVAGNGRVSVTGRIDDVIISGGINVAAGAVEEVLRDCAGIADVAVLGRPDPEWGQAVIALVVPVAGGNVGLAELRACVAARIGAAAAPREIRTVPALPRLHSGKLDRVAAQLLVAEPSPEGLG
ncbi:MAG: o-succinylbenzoate--CoA ligase [Geodermatophilaceae bacterium]